jgi:Tol biopolymer transport system component
MKHPIFWSATALALVGLAGCGGGKKSTSEPTPSPSPSATPGPATCGGGTRKIVYNTDGIFIMNADATNRVRLTTRENNRDVDAALSPDQSKVAFVRPTGTGYRLMMLNADGTNLRELVGERKYLRAPHWHPDGARLVYGSGSSGSNVGIYTINANGTEEKQITEAGNASLPDWSPDGKKLAFVSSRAGTGLDIYTMNADGSNLVRVADTPDYAEWSPRWSPDGKKLVSYCDFTNSVDKRIYVLNVDGTGRTGIGPENARRPSWSPDGKRILYALYLSPVGDLFTIKPDGSEICNVTNSTENEDDPNWQ